MPDPLQPEYGTNLRSLLRIDTATLRKTVEREIRRTLNELAPGVSPGIILDVLVDVTVNASEQMNSQVELSMTATHHSVSYHNPHDGNYAATEPAWTNANPDAFRTEYMAQFQQTHDDMADSMRYATMGVDRAHGRDQTSYSTSATHAALQQERFNELRNNYFPDFYSELRRRQPPKPDPVIAAVIRKKLAPKPPPPAPPPPRKPRSCWARLREDYALFE